MSLFQPDMAVQYPQGAPAFQGNAMPQGPQGAPQGDGSMVPPSEPSYGADMPTLNGPNPNNFEAPLGGQGIPSYTGNPIIDKYIHTFIGEELNPGRPATPPNPGRPSTSPNPGRPSTPPVAPIRSM